MTTARLECKMVSAKEASALCGVGVSTWYVLVAGGRTPGSVRLGRSVKWRLEELLEWMNAGCPARSAWEASGGRKYRKVH